MATILLAETKGRHHAYVSAAKILIASCGDTEVKKLNHTHIVEANYILEAKPWQVSTKALISATMRILLRSMWENYGAPKLDNAVRKYQKTRPRNVTVEREEIDQLLDAAPKHIKMWLLLCSDMAIRSGTAARLGFEHYNKERGELAFITKCQEHVTLPVTDEIRRLIEECNPKDCRSFVRQLWNDPRVKPDTKAVNIPLALGAATRRLRTRLGINHFYQHDLRRTTAVAMYRQTRDIRDVQQLLGHGNLQSTVWYLAGAINPVKRSNLEIIKRPAWRKDTAA